MTTIASIAIVILLAVQAHGEISNTPAAILVFPYIHVDAVTDTRVRLVNTSDGLVGVHCDFDDTTGRRGFMFQLTEHQPIEWLVSQGLADFPLDGVNRKGAEGQANDRSLIPSVRTIPYTGTLRCVTTAVFPSIFPVGENVLIGSAALETASSKAQYAAVGIPALGDDRSGDLALVLGGPSAEYEACPASVQLLHFFDGATFEALGAQHQVSTSVALAPCGETVPERVDVEVYNEFEQRLTATVDFPNGLAHTSLLDTDVPELSIFHVATQGTLAGQSLFRAHSSGALLGVAFEEHVGITETHLAAMNLRSWGARKEQELLLFEDAQIPPSPTPTATHDPPPTGTPIRMLASCPGDCDSNGVVTIDELVRAVDMALGAAGDCPSLDTDGNGHVTVDEIIGAVNRALGLVNCALPL